MEVALKEEEMKTKQRKEWILEIDKSINMRRERWSKKKKIKQ